MKKIPYLLVAFVCLVACSNKQANSSSSQDDTIEFSSYENEFYSLEYPSHCNVEEDIRDKTDGFEQYEGNDKMTLQKHEVDLLNEDGVSFHIVRSNFHFDLPVDEYANVSILSKGLADAGQYQEAIDYNRQKDPNEYLGYWRNDSIGFSGRRAVLLAFEVVTENNDTLIQKQIVVQNNHGDTFYINSTFHKGDELAEAIGDEIFDSFVIK